MSDCHPGQAVSAGGSAPAVAGPTLAWLTDLAGRGAARAAALRRASLGAPQRAGLLFEVGGRQLLAAVDTVAEVLDQPTQLAPVPGTQPWLLGIANHRGTLLPLLDLAALLGGAAPAGRVARAAGRVLIPRHTACLLGIRVGAVIGLRYFRDRDRDDARAANDRTGDPTGDAIGDQDGPDAAGFTIAPIVVSLATSGPSILPVVDLAAIERLPAFVAAARGADASRAAPPG